MTPRPRRRPAPSGSLVAQRHGGALLTGGRPGNRGGGRRRADVRAAALLGADEAVPRLLAMLRNPRARPVLVIQAAQLLLKYGLGTVRELSVEEVKDRLRLTIEVLRTELPADEAQRVLARIRPIWTS